MLHENLINGQLSELLRQYGLDAVPEQRRARKRPDIHIAFDNAAVTIEAEIDRDSSARTRAIQEARERLEQGIASVSVALLYGTATAQLPFGSLTEALRTSNFSWQVLPGAESWQSGNLDQLVSVVRQAPNSADLNINYVARQLTEALDATVEMFAANGTLGTRTTSESSPRRQIQASKACHIRGRSETGYADVSNGNYVSFST